MFVSKFLVYQTLQPSQQIPTLSALYVVLLWRCRFWEVPTLTIYTYRKHFLKSPLVNVCTYLQSIQTSTNVHTHTFKLLNRKCNRNRNVWPGWRQTGVPHATCTCLHRRDCSLMLRAMRYHWQWRAAFAAATVAAAASGVSHWKLIRMHI